MAGLGALKQMFSEIRELQEEAAQHARESRLGLGALAQVADTEAEYHELTGKARRLFKTGGAATLGEAAQTVFSLKSADQLDQLELFKQLRDTGIMAEPAEMAASIRAVTATIALSGSSRVKQAGPRTSAKPSPVEDWMVAAASALRATSAIAAAYPIAPKAGRLTRARPVRV